MYLIRGLVPRTDIPMGHHGFYIELSSDWPDLVAKSGITQQMVERKLSSEGRAWLDACGFDGIFDPDNCGFDADKNATPGPNARPMYKPNRDLRICWGKWGAEHITVPGNACGLDFDSHAFGAILEYGAAMLLPHNIDSWRQKQLLLIAFCEFAVDVMLFSRQGV